MQEPLLSDLGYLADTPAAEQILNGTYVCPPGTDNFTWDFLACMNVHPLWVQWIRYLWCL
jgi:hypothetical protein